MTGYYQVAIYTSHADRTNNPFRMNWEGTKLELVQKIYEDRGFWPTHEWFIPKHMITSISFVFMEK